MPIKADEMLVVFDPATGKSIYTAEAPVQQELILTLMDQGIPFGISLKGSVNEVYARQVGNGWIMTPRPVMSPTWRTASSVPANGTDVIFLDNIPEGAQVRVDGAAFGDVGPDGSMDFGAAHAGTYKVSISLWPYMDYETTFVATATT